MQNMRNECTHAELIMPWNSKESFNREIFQVHVYFFFFLIIIYCFLQGNFHTKMQHYIKCGSSRYYGFVLRLMWFHVVKWTNF